MNIYGHRCCAGEFPENTIEAAKKVAPSIEGVEIDVQRCGDGHPIVFHDETVDRVTAETGSVNEFTHEDLASLSVEGSDATVSHLGDFLRAVPDKTTINIELKSDGLGNLSEFEGSVANDLIWSSFNIGALEEMGRLNPHASLALLFDSDPIKSLNKAMELGCEYIHPHYELCFGTGLVEAAHAAELKVNAWTVNSREVFDKLESVGVDGVITDYRPESFPE